MNTIKKVYIDYSNLKETTVDALRQNGFKNHDEVFCLGITETPNHIVLVNEHGEIHEIFFDDGFEIKN